MSDEEIFAQFMSTTNKMDRSRYVTEDSWRYTTELSGAGGVTNRLKFDTKALKSSVVDWASMYLMLPLGLKSSTVLYTLNPTTTQLAIKASLLSLIYSCVLNSGSGTNLGVNDTGLHLINNVRLLLDQSVNWSNSMGPELCYAKDTFNSPDTTIDAEANTGARLRATYMFNQSRIVTTTTANVNIIEFNAIIPLRYIHDIFQQIGLSVNTHMQVEFGLNFLNGTNTIINGYAPFTVGNDTDYPVISVGNSQFPVPRLYYRSFTLNAMMAEKVSSMVSRGFKKRIYFTCTDTATPLSTDTVAGAAAPALVPFSKTVSTSTVNPLRLIVLTTQAGALANDALPSPFVCTGKLVYSQIKIQDTNYFNSPLESDFEHWAEIIRALPGYGENSQMGGQINFNDFLGDASSATLGGTAAYRIYTFDIDRIRPRLLNPNSACEIQFQSNKVQLGTALDTTTFYYLVEREQTLDIDYSTSEVSFSVGRRD
jgi:hypothetical protein